MNEETVLILNEFTDLKNKLSDLKGMRTKFKNLRIKNMRVGYLQNDVESSIFNLSGRGYIKSFVITSFGSYLGIRVIIDGVDVLNEKGGSNGLLTHFNYNGSINFTDLEFSHSFEVKVKYKVPSTVSLNEHGYTAFALFSVE